MKIKKLLNEQEIDEVCLIDQNSFSSSWKKNIYSKMLISNKYELFGGYIDEKLVSFICLLDTTEVLEILRIAVLPEYRRQGLAENLLKFIAENSVRNELFLEVRFGNSTAIKLYKKFGFEELGIRKKYYKDNNEDAVIMSKKLK